MTIVEESRYQDCTRWWLGDSKVQRCHNTKGFSTSRPQYGEDSEPLKAKLFLINTPETTVLQGEQQEAKGQSKACVNLPRSLYQ